MDTLILADGETAPTRTELSLTDMSRFRLPEQVALSPDGSLCAITVRRIDEARDKWATCLMVVDLSSPSDEPKTLIVVDSADSPNWSPDGQRLSFLSTPGDRSGPGRAIYVWSARDGVVQLTEGLTAPASLTWAPDGSALGLVAAFPDATAEGRRDRTAPTVVRDFGYKMDGVGILPSARRQLAVVDPLSGDVRVLTNADFDVQAPSWSTDSRTIVYARVVRQPRGSVITSDLFDIDTVTGSGARIGAWGGTVHWTGRDPDGFVVFAGHVRPGPSQPGSLYRLRPGDLEPSDLLAGFDRRVMASARGTTPGAIFISGDRALFCARERGCTWVFALSLTAGTVTPWLSGDSLVVQSMDHSPAAGRLALVLSDAQSAGEVYIVDEGDQRQRAVTRFNRWTDNCKVTEPEDFHALLSTGARVHGYLLRGRPAGTPGPTLIDIHGGPDNVWRPSLSPYYLYRQLLTHRGWNVLLLNPRGSDGYGADFIKEPLGRLGWSEEEDFTAAVDALVRDGSADEGKIAVMGASHGGFMTNWLTARTDRFATGISVAGVCDWMSLYGTSSLGDISVPILLSGTPDVAFDRYASSSPLAYVAGVTAPTLLIHGEDDLMNPIGQSEQWFTALRRMDREVEFVRYPSAGHLFMYNGAVSQQKDYSRRIVHWLIEHVENTAVGCRAACDGRCVTERGAITGTVAATDEEADQ
ncbi:S9 family peptidase (plasmid) [Streptomyces viridifaciens]|nr:S9 family peptidase [Streptomyces viridifaciens]